MSGTAPLPSVAAVRRQVTRQSDALMGAPPEAAGAKMEGEGDGASRIVQQELGRDAFLQLLVLQLRNQDPLNPQDNQQMLAQLAQFSALEQMNNLNESFELLSGNVDQLNFISASQLLGREVTGVDLNGQPRSGVVESVHLDGSLVVLRVDGELMSMAGVLQIDSPPGEQGPETPPDGGGDGDQPIPFGVP